MNLETSVMSVIQTQLDLLCTVLKDKSSCSIFSIYNKSFDHQNFLSTAELMLQISKQHKIIPENIVNQLMSMIFAFMSNISIEEKVDAIQFYISKMENFIFFLKARNDSEDEKSMIDKICKLFDNLKLPLEDHQFTYDGTFLREFNEYFQGLMHLALKIKYCKHSESLSRQFITYSKNLEFAINELFQLSAISNQLNYLYSILECYCENMKAKIIDISQDQDPVFSKKPNYKTFSTDTESNLQDEAEIIKIPVVRLCFA